MDLQSFNYPILFLKSELGLSCSCGCQVGLCCGLITVLLNSTFPRIQNSTTLYNVCSVYRGKFNINDLLTGSLGPYYRLTNWLMFLCGQIQSPRPDVMPDRRYYTCYTDRLLANQIAGKPVRISCH